jgi:hypothetical protein
MTDYTEEAKRILFFQSEPMSGNMLADWQVDQATAAILDLTEQAYKAGQQDGAEGFSGWLDAAIHIEIASITTTEGSLPATLPFKKELSAFVERKVKSFLEATQDQPKEVGCPTCGGTGYRPCKICLEKADMFSKIEHSRGCYEVSSDGGGTGEASYCRDCDGSGKVKQS